MDDTCLLPVGGNHLDRADFTRLKVWTPIAVHCEEYRNQCQDEALATFATHHQPDLVYAAIWWRGPSRALLE
jgi:hypothetical protein